MWVFPFARHRPRGKEGSLMVSWVPAIEDLQGIREFGKNEHWKARRWGAGAISIKNTTSMTQSIVRGTNKGQEELIRVPMKWKSVLNICPPEGLRARWQWHPPHGVSYTFSPWPLNPLSLIFKKSEVTKCWMRRRNGWQGRTKEKPKPSCPLLCPKRTLAWGREDLMPHQVKIRIIPEDGCFSFWIKNGFVT